MGGTVRVIYQKPASHYEAAVDASVMGADGGDASYLVQGMINIPLVEDKLALRAVAFGQDRGGYVDNVFLGQKNINGEKASGGRLLLRYQPNSQFTLDLSAFYQDTDASSPTWNQAAGAYNSTSQAELPIHDKLQLYSITGQYDFGPVVATGVVSYYKRNFDQASADVSYYIGGLLGSAGACAKIYNGGAACSPATQDAFDAHVRQNMPSFLYPRQDTDNLTAEFRLSSNTHGRLDWTVGGYYSDRTGHVDNSEINVDPATGKIIRPYVYDYTRLITDELQQLAGFGEASFHVTDKLTLTAGARYFHYNKDVAGETTIPLDLVGARVSPYTTQHSTEDGWVTKFNASYQVNDDVMFYAEAAQGFRPGGVNQVLGLPDALSPYESDSLWNYEAGVKTAWFNNRLIFNIDAYRIDWSNMQVSGTTPNGAFRFIANAGAARINGIEADATLNPFAGLQIQANAAYTDAKLSEDQVNANVSAAGRAGDRIPYIPKFSGGLSAQYNWPLSDTLGGMARADVNYVGTSYSEFRPNGPFYRRIGSYSLTNLRAGVESDTGGWGAYLFVDNLFYNDAITYATASAISAGQTLVVSGRPRTIGVNIRKHF
jgi:outer membrane receptor protein involved in Fe transport